MKRAAISCCRAASNDGMARDQRAAYWNPFWLSCRLMTALRGCSSESAPHAQLSCRRRRRHGLGSLNVLRNPWTFSCRWNDGMARAWRPTTTMRRGCRAATNDGVQGVRPASSSGLPSCRAASNDGMRGVAGACAPNFSCCRAATNDGMRGGTLASALIDNVKDPLSPVEIYASRASTAAHSISFALG